MRDLLGETCCRRLNPARPFGETARFWLCMHVTAERIVFDIGSGAGFDEFERLCQMVGDDIATAWRHDPGEAFP